MLCCLYINETEVELTLANLLDQTQALFQDVYELAFKPIKEALYIRCDSYCPMLKRSILISSILLFTIVFSNRAQKNKRRTTRNFLAILLFGSRRNVAA